MAGHAGYRGERPRCLAVPVAFPGESGGRSAALVRRLSRRSFQRPARLESRADEHARFSMQLILLIVAACFFGCWIGIGLSGPPRIEAADIRADLQYGRVLRFF